MFTAEFKREGVELIREEVCQERLDDYRQDQIPLTNRSRHALSKTKFDEPPFLREKHLV